MKFKGKLLNKLGIDEQEQPEIKFSPPPRQDTPKI